MINFIEANLTSGQMFVDVGAWIGVYSMLAAQLVGETGRVYAFEPDPLARQSLRRNLANNVSRVEVLPLALSNRVGFKTMELSGNSGSRILDETSISKSPNFIRKLKVEATTLDEFLASIGQIPDIIKIDVEGHEIEVIEGALQTLRDHRTTIIMEVHDVMLRPRGVDPDIFIHRIECALGTRAICLDTRFLDAPQLAERQVATRHIVIGNSTLPV